MQFMKTLCRTKYQQAMADNEGRLLRQRIIYYNSSAQSFDRSSISSLACVDSIQKSEIRQQFLAECKEVAQQARAAMFTLATEIADVEKNEYKKKYDATLKTLWSERHVSSANEKMSISMIDLIERRCKKIDERIDCLYRFKHEALSLNSKT